MDQYGFLNNFSIETFKKNTAFNSLKNVRAENEGERLETLTFEGSFSKSFNLLNFFSLFYLTLVFFSDSIK